jgi:hypothetical protein
MKDLFPEAIHVSHWIHELKVSSSTSTIYEIVINDMMKKMNNNKNKLGMEVIKISLNYLHK